MNAILEIQKHLKGDRAIWLISFILGVFSLLAVYSAAGSEAHSNYAGNTEFPLIKQLLFITLGFVVMYVCYSFDYMRYSKLAPLLLAVSVILLLYTMKYGGTINQAKRWLVIPLINVSVQVSDIAKFSLILFMARALSMRQDVIKSFKQALVPIIIPVGFVCFLILPSGLSTGVLLFVTCLIMMFVGRVSMKYISIMILAGLIGFLIVWSLGQSFPELFPRVTTWGNRYLLHASEDGGYQVVLSKIAIAEGGIFGEGPGNSFQRNYLPYCYADFIYAIICEEYGLIGGIITLMLYLWLLVRCIGIVTRCPKTFGAILAMGLCLNIVIQAFSHMAVVVGLVPPTGQTLPLISMGGTSILFTCMSLGIILSISRYVEDAQLEKVELTEIERNEGNR